MCVIIDVNFLNDYYKPDVGHPIFKAVDVGRIKGIVGGEQMREITGEAKREWLEVGIDSGKLRQVDEAEIHPHAEGVNQTGLTSNDPHILALAKASGAKLLATLDEDLMEDFKNKAIIGGKIIPKTPDRRELDDLIRKNPCP